MGNEKKNRNWSLVVGVIMLLLSPVVYFISKNIMCSGCQQVGCAICDLEALLLSGGLLLFSIILAIVSYRYFKRSLGAKRVFATTVRWFFIVALGIIGIFALCDVWLRLGQGRFNAASVALAAISIGVATILFVTKKRA